MTDDRTRFRNMTRLDFIERIEALEALLDQPGIDEFLTDVQREAAHQLARWGPAHDRNKTPADWFWLIGYLAGKALHAHTAGDEGKARHHTISSAAALFHWHIAISARRDPDRHSDLEKILNRAFGSVTNV